VATVDHAAAAAHLLDLRGALLDLREQRIAGMAAELAGALAVGDDCPVCGSAEHPRPAVAVTGHPDAAAERRAQRLVDDAQVVEHALDLRVSELDASIETAALAAGDTDPEELQMAVSAADRARAATAALAARHPELVEQLRVAGQRAAVVDDERSARRVRAAELSTAVELVREQATALDDQVRSARGDHPALSAAVDHLESRRTLVQAARAAVTAREAAHTALADAAVSWGRAALEAGFDTTDEARAAELTPDDLAGLEAALRDHEARVTAARQVLADPASSDLLATPVPDVQALEAAHREAAELLERARAAHEVSVRRHDRVRGLTDDLGTALEDWAPLRERLALATAVSSFAEGKAPDNRLQMRLSAYVLAHRLSQVVAAANARLAGMSDQRYSLEHVGRRGAGESRGGLSLVVRDDWSGESRDPATLSGGETFVVSLALALGLADVVAHEAGGADLATLFVDEGFGSLDAETLDDVLDILDTLRENGRAVGVVSHVAEMRDRIPTQLVVTKARSGSRLRISC
jgi:exonuclease SbcC